MIYIDKSLVPDMSINLNLSPRIYSSKFGYKQELTHSLLVVLAIKIYGRKWLRQMFAEGKHSLIPFFFFFFLFLPGHTSYKCNQNGVLFHQSTRRTKNVINNEGKCLGFGGWNFMLVGIFSSSINHHQR